MKAMRAPAILAAVVLAVLLYGLGTVLWGNVQVAPEAKAAAADRITPHMKNVTRFAGPAEEVARAVHRAVFRDEQPSAPPPPAENWREWFRQQVSPEAMPRHLVVLPGDDAALPWALPGLFWAAYARVPVVFVSAGALDAASEALLRQHHVPAFVLAPARVLGDDALARLREGGRRVERVAADAVGARDSHRGVSRCGKRLRLGSHLRPPERLF